MYKQHTYTHTLAYTQSYTIDIHMQTNNARTPTLTHTQSYTIDIHIQTTHGEYGVERWNGIVEWTARVEYWTGLLEGCGYTCAKLSLPWRASCGKEGILLYLCEPAMDQDSAMPLGTENDPIVILDSSPGYNAK